MTAPMTAAELRALPAVVSVPLAGRAYGIGERHAYELVRCGAFPVPVLRLGRLLKVRSADLIADLVATSGEAETATDLPLALTDPVAATEVQMESPAC